MNNNCYFMTTNRYFIVLVSDSQKLTKNIRKLFITKLCEMFNKPLENFINCEHTHKEMKNVIEKATISTYLNGYLITNKCIHYPCEKNEIIFISE